MMRMGSETPRAMAAFSPVPTDLKNKFSALRAGSEPNDFFNDRTGLRKSAFPIKLAGIMMGSQENLAGSEDEETGNGNGCELRDLWRRRSRRNSLSTNHSTNSMDRRSLSINPSTDRRSLSSNPTPFGVTGHGVPSGKPVRRQALGRWGQQQTQHQQQQQQQRRYGGASSSCATDDEDSSVCSSKPPSLSPSDKNLLDTKNTDKNLSDTRHTDKHLLYTKQNGTRQNNDKTLFDTKNTDNSKFNDIKNLLSDIQSDIEAVGGSTKSLLENDNILKTNFSTKSHSHHQQEQHHQQQQYNESSQTLNKIEQQQHSKTENIHTKIEQSEGAKKFEKSERRMSNYMITSSVEIEESVTSRNNDRHLSQPVDPRPVELKLLDHLASSTHRSSITPDDLPRLMPLSYKGSHLYERSEQEISDVTQRVTNGHKEFTGITQSYKESTGSRESSKTNGWNRASVRDDLENASSVSVEETVVIRAPSLHRTFNSDAKTSHLREENSNSQNGSASNLAGQNDVDAENESSSKNQKLFNSTESKSSNITKTEFSSSNSTINSVTEKNKISTDTISEQNFVSQANDVTMTKQFSQESCNSFTTTTNLKSFCQNSNSSETMSNTARSLYQNSTPKMFKPFNQNTQNQYGQKQHIQTTQNQNIQDQTTQNQTTQNIQKFQNTQNQSILSSDANTHNVSSSTQNSVTKNCHLLVQKESSSSHSVENSKEERSTFAQTQKTAADTRPVSPPGDFRPFSSISITSDVFEVDDEEVIYHEPEKETPLIQLKPEIHLNNLKPEMPFNYLKPNLERQTLSRKSDQDVIEVTPEQVSYRYKIPEKAVLSPPPVNDSKMLKKSESLEKISSTKKQFEASFEQMSSTKMEMKNCSSNLKDFVLSKDETDALEKLFDRLVDSRNQETPKRSMTESSIGSSVNDVDATNDVDYDDNGDDSSDTTETESRSLEKKLSKTKHQPKTEWLNRCSSSTNPVTSTKDDSSIVEKVRRKRRRNRTIDYHDLPNGGDDLWCGTVAGYTQRSFNEVPIFSTEVANKVSGTSDSEEGLGHGLGLIIDKLKNIETKLDELKTLDQSVWYPDLPEDGLSDSTILDDYLRTSSSTSIIINSDNKNVENDLVAPATHSNVFSDAHASKALKIETDDDCESDDRTLVDDLEIGDEERCDSVVTHTDEALHFPEEEVHDAKNILICSPSPEPSGLTSSIQPQRGHLRISSISSMSEAEEEIGSTYVPHLILPDEEEEEDLSIGRESRIEELAKKMMSKVDEEIAAKKKDNERRRHPSEPTPRTVNLELDTVSERSEIEDEDGGEGAEQNASLLKRRPPSTTSGRLLRTRSASRERSLPKIRYCWRCHQTGHESFDCSAELNPDFWCPRCLESTHWEDSCWVNDKEVFCNICTLPGHLPCVHETSDFRQRKLVVETFGWLAFKDWFREPDFWSWWNCAGFTNVPLYKLMQHRPRIASPDMQQPHQ